jgi:phthalate 4,5-cis-dihydrodiol dehydrogenase
MTPVLHIGIVGLGTAMSLMLPSFLADDRIRIAGVTDNDQAAAKRFAEDHQTKAFGGLDEMVADPAIRAVYIATPHAAHAEQARTALLAGKHVLVEKPLALTVEDGLGVAKAAQRAGLHVIVGHTHAFDPAVRLMSQIIASGRLGRVAMINSWTFNAFLYRPRRAEELTTELGGGVLFNQVPHQVDIARLLGGGRVRSVRGAAFVLDPDRPTEGSQSSLLFFESGAVASLVFSGYDYFDSDEFYGWFAESGRPRRPAHGQARRALRESTVLTPEADLRARTAYSGRGTAEVQGGEKAHPHFGVLLVNCERGDLRATPDGVALYSDDGHQEIRIPRDGPLPDRRNVVDDLYRAAVLDEPTVHDAAWGTATVEVCQAILRSSREQREITLRYQTGIHGRRTP